MRIQQKSKKDCWALAILYLLKSWGQCCYKRLFLLFPSPPRCVDFVETKLECTTQHQHCTGRKDGEEKCIILTSYCVFVLRVLTRVVVIHCVTLELGVQIKGSKPPTSCFVHCIPSSHPFFLDFFL